MKGKIPVQEDKVILQEDDYEEFVELFEAEGFRKEELLKEFEKLELKELRSKKLEFKDRKYDRMFRGAVIVSKIYPAETWLTKSNGKLLGKMLINPEIAEHLKLNDQLELTVGLRGGYWRIVFLAAIGSHLPEVTETQSFH
jgi:hypothetical protein